MPEGHTLHRAARDHSPILVGQQLQVSSPQGRFAAGAAQLDGHRCTAVEAYGKHLVYRFANHQALHIHLGLFGRFRTAKLFTKLSAKLPVKEPRGAVRVRMISTTHVVDINGPNTCEVLDPPQLDALIARIGPDVLRSDAEPDLAWTRISKSRVAIGQLLMDQAVVAGIGNIYRSEILWRQKVHPKTPGNQITRAVFDQLWSDAVLLLAIGVKNNAIITVDGVKKSRSKYGERVNIFGKLVCPACATNIETFSLATRRVFVCASCQPPPA